MKYRDEFRIASTAILLSVAMFGISVVVPKESRVPTAKTTLVEAPETAAEAEAAAEQTEFPIYNQESNYDTSYDNSQDYYEPDTSGDSSDPANSGDSSGSDQITYPSEDTGDGSGDTSEGDTSGGDASGGDTSGGDAPAIPDYTETPGDGYEPSEDNNWDYVAPGADSGADGSDGSDSAQPDMEVYE